MGTHQPGRNTLLHSIRKTALTVGVIGAAGLGGSALADAASNNAAKAPQSREAVSGDAAAKGKAAALAKVPGATVVRTEAGGPYGSAYHAHVKTSDGTLKVVLVDKDFQAPAVQADNGRRGRGDHGPRGGGPGAGETALTGDTKDKV